MAVGVQTFVEHADAGTRLDTLAAKVRLDLARLDYPNREWLPAIWQTEVPADHDVVVVGAGQGGLAVALALWRERVRNVLVIDRAEEGQEGPWITFARMVTLRTPKYLTGPDAGIADMTFAAWYAARFQGPDWDSLERIPRPMWMEYLTWCRRVIPVDVRNRTELLRIEPDGPGRLLLRLETPDGPATLTTRKVVLANGLEGSGLWHTPPTLSEKLPRGSWAHTSDRIDFEVLRGRRVGVLGIGASAVDAALAAANAGADVDLFHRRQPVLGERRGWVENLGFLRHFADLPDATKWRAMHGYFSAGTPAPASSFERMAEHPGIRVHSGEPWKTTSGGDPVTVATPEGRYDFDFLIFGTGIRVDPDLRPELAAFRGQIACWADRYTPPGGLESATMGRYPYLGSGAELTEKSPGAAPHLGRIHVFNWGATISQGISSSSITGMKFGMERIIRGITRDFYFGFADEHVRSFPAGIAAG